MLIKCSKHTNDDLSLWKSYEEMDIIYYNNHDMKNKENKTIEYIKNFNANYCSISWGKDSLVLADIILRNKIKMQFVNLKVLPSRNIYCDKIRDIFLNIYPEIKYEEIIVNYKNIYSLNLPENIQDKETDKLFYNGFKKASKKYGKKYLSGVRGEESGTRKLKMKRWGIKTERTCTPLGYWKVQEIFAYLSHYNLPIHPNYGMLGNGRWERNKLRVAELNDIHGRQYDRELWEKEYYTEEIRKLEKHYEN